MAEKYGCKHYIDDCKNLKYGDNYVVQINSLHKINLDYFDYVVLDEFESLLMYIVNGVKTSPYIISILRNFKIILDEKKLLVLDAMLSTHKNIINRDVIFYNNEYRADTEVVLYEHKNTFFTALEYACESKNDDEVITASFSTLSELKMVEKILREKGLKVITINSETNEYVRDNIFTNYFKKTYVHYDCILYSPSITVGLSIMNNVKTHFHFDNSSSIDAISSIQMIKRSRTANSIHIFVNGGTKCLIPPLREKGIETNDIPDLCMVNEFYLKLCKFYDTIELNHTIAFKILLQNQFKNFKSVGSIVSNTYKTETKEKVYDIGEFEGSVVEPLILEGIKKNSSFIDYIRNFIFYIKIKDKEKYLDNYITSNPSNLLSCSKRVKFMKYSVEHPNIVLKDKFLEKDITLLPNCEYLKGTEFLSSLGYNKNGKIYTLNPDILNVLKQI